MKRGVLLNRHLSTLVAELGHLDEVVVADAGLPGPKGVPVIDLAVTSGVPGLAQVLSALTSELTIEHATVATEADNSVVAQILGNLGETEGTTIAPTTIPHDVFKKRTAHAKAMIRTGETTPYANVILSCGVAF